MFSLGAIAFEHADNIEAATWLRRAADGGHARALFWIGKLHWCRGMGEAQTLRVLMGLDSFSQVDASA
jgi:hypothetical protein